MKRILALLVSLSLMLSFTLVSAENEAAKALNGFTLKETRRFELLGADIELYEHDKTGALVMFILNDDLNRTFEITVRTPAETDKGIAHVLEHSVLDGSEKYPSKSLFFNLSYQTYNTYMNAATYNFMTTYPVASLSEAQLLKLADFYTDSVFNPMIIEDESIFREEAWRYTLSDAEGELGIAGTVYSEMQGAYTIQRAASLNFDKTLFPGSTVGHDHGGTPEVIPTMSWEDLQDFHGRFYHPSNSLTCIYGKIEQKEDFLKLLDGYFSTFEKKDFDLSDALYTPVNEPQTNSFVYPLAAGADTANGSVVYYGFAIDCPKEDVIKLDYLTTLLSDDSSYFSQAMLERLPGASGACYIDLTTPETCVYFYASEMDPEKAPVFKQIVDEAIVDAAENGFDPEAVDAIVAADTLSILLANESSSLGTDMIPNIAYYWAAQDDLFGYMDYIDGLDSFAGYAKDGTLSKAAKDYLVGNNRNAFVVTSPVAGMQEEIDAALAASLAEIKAGMSEEEISAIVAMTNAEDPADDASQYVKALTAVTVDSLPEEVREYEVSDETNENGVRFVTVDANVDGVGETALLLDASGLTQDQLHFFKLYVDLMGNLDTAKHTVQQLASLQTRYFYNGIIRVSVMNSTHGLQPYMRCTFTALDEDLDEGYDLIYELLYETDFTNAQTLADRVSTLKNSLKRTLQSSCYQVMLYRAMGDVDATSAYFNYVSYLDYYDFLTRAEQALSEQPETVIGGLQAIQQYFFNRTNAVAGFVGSEESAALNAQAAESFLMKLDAKEIAPQQYDFGKLPESEALIVDGTVNYNMFFASWEELGLEGFDGAMDAITSYVTDTYLYPMLRDQYGAYGVMHAATDAGVYIISYRDPNLLETYAVYATLGDLISQDEPSQDTLNGYIQSSYSAYTLSNGELTDGFSALLEYFDDTEKTDTVEYMRQLKAITPETFKQYAALYEQLTENAFYATSGSAAAINANAEMFDRVLNPFGVQDASQVELTDVTEDYPYYSYVRAVYENAYMLPISETEFGVNAPATLGDLATAMYIAVGGDNNAEDAIAFLSGYGILSAAPADTVLTRDDIAGDCLNFYMALGEDVQPVALGEYADADSVDAEVAGYYGWVFDGEKLLLADEGNLLNLEREATRGELCYTIYMMLIGE